MKSLELIASWVVGVGEWVVALLQKTPSFTAMYLLTIYGMHESILQLMSSGWCDMPDTKDDFDCGAGLIAFSAMAFILLAVTVSADYHRLDR